MPENFERLTAWLRKKGVKANKPLHALRKEFGSQICAVHGIHAAATLCGTATSGRLRSFTPIPETGSPAVLATLSGPNEKVVDMPAGTRPKRQVPTDQSIPLAPKAVHSAQELP
jgi:hypothetical protein